MYPQASRGRGCLYTVLGVIGFGLVVMIVIIIAVAVAASHSRAPGSGTTTHPAAADVAVTSCALDPTLNLPVAGGTIVNHSSGTSDYNFTISFFNSAGTVVARGRGLEDHVAPHQAAAFSVIGNNHVSAPLTCKVVDVTRFASIAGLPIP
jgi:hypothetical protein